MAIKINNLRNNLSTKNTYVDIHFDLLTVQKDGGKGMTRNLVSGKDIVVDVNTTALKNSLVNLLTTSKGQRPLKLNYGINLNRYLGEPISEATGKAIANEIERGINLWEPRVELKRIYIIPVVDSMMFEILIVINPRFLTDKDILLTGNLAQEKGFNFVEGPLVSVQSPNEKLIA